LLAGIALPARMPQKAERYGEIKVLHSAAFGTRQQQVVRAEHGVRGYFGRHGRHVEQSAALFDG